MATAVLVPPSPHDTLSMVNMATAGHRRAPLASIPNATNSPHRFLTTSGSKRSRAQANISLQENEPPQKRLAVDKANTGPVTPTRNTAEGRVFDRGNGTTGSNAFQKKLVAAASQSKPGMRVTKNVEPTQKEDSQLRRWQEHYRKLFPSFSFYFDGFTEPARAREQAQFVKHILHLGAVSGDMSYLCGEQIS
jgi:regulatory subunit for Cdc7p protein kinase